MLIVFAKIYLALVAIMSVVAFLLFGVDKRRAIKESKSRVSEKTLHLISLFGGWPGALVGQRLFRHKTIKRRFRLVLLLIVVSHLALILCWIWLSLK